jgi:hypothetical protein
MTDLFDAPILLEEDAGYFYARPASARTEV